MPEAIVYMGDDAEVELRAGPASDDSGIFLQLQCSNSAQSDLILRICFLHMAGKANADDPRCLRDIPTGLRCSMLDVGRDERTVAAQRLARHITGAIEVIMGRLCDGTQVVFGVEK